MNDVPPKALIFDWDNTLVDSWGCILEALNIALCHMGHDPWTQEDMHSKVSLSLRDNFPILFGNRWEEARDVYYEAFKAIHLTRLKPLEGMAEMLARLQGRGLRMSVVSNKNGDYLRAEARHLGWDGYFHRLVGATDAPKDKPAIEPVHMALEGTGIEPGPGVWFVGDAVVDMECAQAAGCVPVLLRAQPPRKDEFSCFSYRHHFPSAQAFLSGLGQ
ncbi:MAG: HAD family hydrolase [Alphaproteobacteria bacterium]|nr:HAD family hydrolase [Alphaproteobacteria bacterium]